MTSTAVVHDDDDEISPYMRRVLEKRARNEQYMKEIGLLDFRDTLKKEAAVAKKKKSAKHAAPKVVVVTPGQERRSPRHKKKSSTSPTLLMLSYYQHADDDDTHAVVSQDKDRTISASTTTSSSENNNIAYTTALSTTRKRRIRPDVELSEKDKQVLRGVDDIHDETYLLQTFQEFLDRHDKISDQNARNVMRQVRKLVLGEGVRYESPKYAWPEGCYFLRGTKVTLASDFVDLLQQASEAEDRWGQDRGNGWLLSHPLKKLLNFQQFILAHPHVFAKKKNGAE
jgi:hypothetical protein